MRKKKRVQDATRREHAERMTLPGNEPFHWLDEGEIRHIVSILNKRGGANPQEAWEILTWANTVRLQHNFLELFMLEFVDVKIGDLPDPSSDDFQEEWRIWSSVMVSPTESPAIEELVKIGDALEHVEALHLEDIAALFSHFLTRVIVDTAKQRRHGDQERPAFGFYEIARRG